MRSKGGRRKATKGNEVEEEKMLHKMEQLMGSIDQALVSDVKQPTKGSEGDGKSWSFPGQKSLSNVCL